MTTYNTYQEAKIANPECDIYATKISMGGRVEVFGVYVIIGNITSNYHICDPSKYCMTVERFLADGYRFVKGDIYLNSNGRTLGVVNIPDYNNERSTIDCDLYILRAAALENIPTETPEEKEVLDGIESSGEVEWKNGDKPKSGQDVFIAKMNTLSGVESKRYFIHQYWCNSNHQNQLLDLGILFTDSDSATSKTKSLLGIAEEAPETPQQRKDRERLEAAYDLYEEAQHAIGCIGYDDFDFFKKSDIQVKFWLAIVDKTNYRKEKTHGTN
ncbi:hypothetical protein VPHK122_0087 [Vibrio phage K122]